MRDPIRAHSTTTEGIPPRQRRNSRAGSPFPNQRPRPKPQQKQDYKTGSQKGDPRRIPWGPTRIYILPFPPPRIYPSSSLLLKYSSHASGMAGPSSTRSTPLLSAPRLSARVRATSLSYFLPTTHSFLFLITVVGCLLRFVTCQSSFFVVSWVG